VIDRVRPGKNDLTLLLGRLAYGNDPSPRHIATSVSMYERTPSATLAAFVDLARFDAHDALSLIAVPTLVMAGTRDLITPSTLSEEIARCVPWAELILLDGCGHLAPFERYEELTAHLRKFAERVVA
jgi:pimeloyl-ACP methyl ester carboxylesterase